jgi:cardiolipin synthase
MRSPDSAAAPAPPYRDPDPFTHEAGGHVFTFYPHGKDRLDALLALIESAQQSLKGYYFLYSEDATGTAVRDALIAAARRGVDVCLLVDDFACSAPTAFFDPLVEAGGSFARFSPRAGGRYLIRNHQKMMIADDTRLMGGGFNISDSYFAPPQENGWCDLGVAIEGPVAGKFSEWFAQLSDAIRPEGTRFRAIRRMVRGWDAGEGAVQLHVSGPSLRTRGWPFRVRRDLADARRADLVTAYFGPPRSFRRALRRLARRARLRMVLAGQSDFAITIDGARTHYRSLVWAGADLKEFQPCKLHMKLLVIDDISYIGSGNLDMRSIRINLELMVRIEDAALAARLRELIDHLDDACVPIDRAWFKAQGGWLARMRWRMGWFMLRAVDYNLARTLNHDLATRG